MDSYRLNSGAIVVTAQRLSLRIDERFAGRGISGICHHLVETARSTQDRVEDLERPHWRLRIALALFILVATGLLLAIAVRLNLGASDVRGFDEWIMVAEAALQDLVFVVVAGVFLRSLEGRLKRRGALVGLHELRSVAHVIDMHQLTKDPEALLTPAQRTEHSPARDLTRFELTRYLDYCSEMLSLTAKLAAMYAQTTQDAVVLGAVREIESLTSDLSSEVWQKAILLQELDPSIT